MKVFTVKEDSPEILAYGLAKYSRSSMSLLDSLKNIHNSSKGGDKAAADFLETNLIGYGHASIADMAHVTTGIEDISLLAAIEIVDEALWDGQERSTRYQDFSKPSYYTPTELEGSNLILYHSAIAKILVAYQKVHQGVYNALVDTVPMPEGTESEYYRRTLRARAFDVARYLLPLAMHTSLGQIVSARTLEKQITRLSASPYTEVREIAQGMKRTAQDTIVPTLLRYTEPSSYQGQQAENLSAVFYGCWGEFNNGNRKITNVTLTRSSNLLFELLATALYEISPDIIGYESLYNGIQRLDIKDLHTLVEAIWIGRGAHDEWRRTQQVGQAFSFDIVTDIGSYRDLHRHRRCIQIRPSLFPIDLGPVWWNEIQDIAFPTDTKNVLERGDIPEVYDRAMADMLEAIDDIREVSDTSARYLLPLGWKTKALFKMDIAEAAYIIEQRTKPAGHFAYRDIAWKMYNCIEAEYPEIAQGIRVTEPTNNDLLIR